MVRFSYFAYALLSTLLFPVVLLAYLFRVWITGKERSTYRYRLGLKYAQLPFNQPNLLFHGVSAGEVQLAYFFAGVIQERFPDVHVYISTVTDTGFRWLKQKKHLKVQPVLLPLDFPFLIGRFLKHISPEAIVIFETELWPSLITEAKRKGIPLCLLNGRISDRSFPRYKKWRFLFCPLIQAFSFIALSSPDQEKRFLELGASQEQLILTGNLKIDLVREQKEIPETIQSLLPKGKRVLLLASTHDEEEELLLELFFRAPCRQAFGYVVIVPRHPERAKRIQEQSQRMGLSMALRSKGKQGEDGLVVDSVGELSSFYAKADVAILGGSFVPVGGHNFMEPIVQGTPVLVGPYMQNFKEMLELFSKDEGVYRVTEQTLPSVLEEALKEGQTKARAGQAKIYAMQGISRKLLHLFQERLPHVVEKLVI